MTKKIFLLSAISLVSCAPKRTQLRASAAEPPKITRKHTLAEFGASDPDPFVHQMLGVANIIGLSWIVTHWSQ